MSAKRTLTHVDATGKAAMVDVAAKPESQRVATAAAHVWLSAPTLALVRAGKTKKGDVISIARIAAIMAAKRTHELIPLCHPLRLTEVKVECAIEADGITIEATVRAFDRTGVEMEALTAASVAALTIYDMVKSVERNARFLVWPVSKDGGRGGAWRGDAPHEFARRKRR